MNSRLFLFGLPHIEVQGVLVEVKRRKVLGLLAYLARHGQIHSREFLAALFWPDLDQGRSLAALRRTLIDLKSLIPPEALSVNRQSITLLSTETLWIDVKAFEEYIYLSREQDTPSLLDSLREAARLYEDDFMAGFTLASSVEFDNWQVTEREAFRLKFSNVLRQLIEYHAAQAEYKQAITYAARYLMLDPLDETQHRMLMRLYAHEGQTSAALRQYQECIRILDTELGVEPSAETITLYEQIRNNEVSLAPPRNATMSILPPLPALLIGRDDVRDELYSKLRAQHPILAIQGWPGVGKSTLAALLAHDPAVRMLYPDGALWVSLGENPNLLAELSKWAKALNIPIRGYTLQAEELSNKIAVVLREKRVLLIVDDVWQIAHANLFKVCDRNSALIFTTRFNDIARELTPTPDSIYKLRVLGETSSLALLKVLAPEVVASYPKQALALVNDLEGLPLALQVAGRLLHTESQLGWGIVDLLDELREGEALMHANAPASMIGLAQETLPTVAALIQKSTDRLDDTTRGRFAYLSLFAPKPATFDLGAMTAVWNIPDPRPTIRTLVDRGLLDPLADKRFQIHALLIIHARTIFALKTLKP